MLFVADSAKERIEEIIKAKNLTEDFFLRVSVASGGCSGLSYQMDFDNESKPNDQVFDDNGVRLVTDLKSFFISMQYYIGVFRRLEWQRFLLQ